MIKVVRFNENEHKDLINYINNYTDEKNQPNISEAIRHLMQLGFESLNSNNINKDNCGFNMDELKQQILEEISANESKGIIEAFQLSQKQNAEQIQQLLLGIQETIKNNSIVTKANDVIENDVPIKKKKVVDVPVDANPFLQNLLNNANR